MAAGVFAREQVRSDLAGLCRGLHPGRTRADEIAKERPLLVDERFNDLGVTRVGRKVQRRPALFVQRVGNFGPFG